MGGPNENRMPSLACTNGIANSKATGPPTVESRGASGVSATVSGPSRSNEKRVDPEDNVAYTFQELSQYYKGTYKRSEIQYYWDNVCRPLRVQKTDKTKAKAKAVAHF